VWVYHARFLVVLGEKYFKRKGGSRYDVSIF